MTETAEIARLANDVVSELIKLAIDGMSNNRCRYMQNIADMLQLLTPIPRRDVLQYIDVNLGLMPIFDKFYAEHLYDLNTMNRTQSMIENAIKQISVANLDTMVQLYDLLESLGF